MDWLHDLDYADKRVMPFKVRLWRHEEMNYTDAQLGLMMRAIVYAWMTQREFPRDIFALPSQHLRAIFRTDARKLRTWWTTETSDFVRGMVAARAPLKRGTRERVFEMDNGHCAHCGVKLDPDNFHVDHLVPVVNGGLARGGNLAASCPDCNRRKGPRQ